LNLHEHDAVIALIENQAGIVDALQHSRQVFCRAKNLRRGLLRSLLWIRISATGVAPPHAAELRQQRDCCREQNKR
jgi:hypothetical protein